MGLSLANEIRRALVHYNKPVHPANIRRWVLNERAALEIESFEQSLETFNRTMRKMPDVESVYDSGIWYRQFIKTGKLYETKQQLTRGIKWLTIQFKILSIRLGTIKELISECYRRLK